MRSDEIFLESGLVFIAKQASRLADTAEPKQGFRPCIPRDPPGLTGKCSRNLSIYSNVTSRSFKSTQDSLSKNLSKGVRDLMESQLLDLEIFP